MASKNKNGLPAAQRGAIAELKRMSRSAKRQPTHSELLTARAALGKVQRGNPLHQRLAAAEHQAFARETVESNPLRAIPMLAMTPGYYLAKKAAQATGIDKRFSYFSGTKADLDQLASGYRGIGQGLKSAMGIGQSTKEMLASRDALDMKMREGREVLAHYKPRRKKNIHKSMADMAMNSKMVSHLGYDGE